MATAAVTGTITDSVNETHLVAGAKTLIITLTGDTWIGAGGEESPTYLLSEDFEGTGVPTGWSTVAGSPDYDYTTGPLVGARSLYMPQGANVNTLAFTAQDELWIYFQIQIVAAVDVTRTILYLQPGTGSYLQITNAELLKIVHGAASVTTVGALTQGTTYHVWVHWKDESAAGALDGQMSVEFQETATKTGTGNNYASLSTGSSGPADLTSLRLYCDAAGATYKIDKLRVLDTEIGSNPS